MIRITFNTKTHTMVIKDDNTIGTKEYPNVMTIKEFQGFYEVRQRQQTTDKNAPIWRVPINNTIIEYIHE
jgi:hypothetical protein